MDDDAEAQEESSITDGAAGAGAYDPVQGRHGQDHPVGEDFREEVVRYGEDERRRKDPSH